MEPKLKALVIPTVFIGIDPGVHNGIAIYRKKRRHLYLKTVKFWDLIRLINSLLKKRYEDPLFVVLEYPNFIKPTFGRENIPEVRFLDRRAQDVGSNKRTAELIKDYLEMCDIEYTLVRPSKKSPKWDKRKFDTVTDYEGPHSQHARDAAKLLYEFTI